MIEVMQKYFTVQLFLNWPSTCICISLFFEVAVMFFNKWTFGNGNMTSFECCVGRPTFEDGDI